MAGNVIHLKTGDPNDGEKLGRRLSSHNNDEFSSEIRREFLSLATDDELFDEIEAILIDVESGQMSARDAMGFLFCRMA